MQIRTVCALLLAIGVNLARFGSASVIGIDLGADWLKVSIVKAGVPLDIVLNRESKRKTDAIVTVRDNIRYFGSEAAGLSTRYPETTYPFIKSLIGVQYNDPIAAEYRSIYSNNMIPDDVRSTCAFSITKDGSIYTVEEILGMQLAHAKKQAEISGGESVSGAVITVPPYLTHHERQAILDAAEIAGLRVLQLMNDGTAIALNYGMGNAVSELEYHLFFDMGAGSTVATLAKFTTGKVKKNTITSIEIVAVGYDKTLGGKAIDIKLQKHLAKVFMQDVGARAREPITSNARSMTRLLKEANRVKQILSANTETIASIEGVHEEIDFKVKVTRADLEKLIGDDYFEKLLVPIKTVLKEADLPLSKLNSLVLVGGAVRIPAVQTSLKKLVGDDKIAQKLNGDEANVLGAGFRAAGISKQFKVREFKIKDTPRYPIEITYNLQESASSVATTTLFPTNTSLPSKKLMAFKRSSDFEFTLAYKDRGSSGSGTPILTAAVGGLEDALAARKENYESVKVQAQIDLGDSGVVVVDHALATFEMKAAVSSGSIAESVLNFFGGKKESKEGNSESEDVKEDESSDQKSSEKKTESTKDDKKSDSKKSNSTESDSKKVTTEKVKLTVNIKYETLAPLTKRFKDDAKKRFAIMDEEDAGRRAREEAMNNLESFIYSSQAFLESPDLPSVTTEDQRENLAKQVESAQTWLDDEGFDADTETLKNKFKDLKSIRAPMYNRLLELTRRPEAVAALRQAIISVTAFVESIRTNNTIEDHVYFGVYEDSEFEAGFTKIKEAEAWIDEVEKKQAAVAPHETPVFKAREVELKKEELETGVVKLFVKQPKKVVKPKVTTTEPAKKATLSSSTSASTGETSTPVDPESNLTEEEAVDDNESSETAQSEETIGHDEL
ncbi:Hypoxia up-regulated protein 1 [Physocladia obscura]|uniref:Hypoxia up-regulated protein 1 n=1 Tax=Physocladia obscura TaxID=109957 RepID=A0AAD5XII0_9FUNG|nr:Hypoxia up-regulated protein 1 [Physocladia obscura]